MTWVQHDEQEQNYNNTTNKCKINTLTQLNAQELRMQVENPCDLYMVCTILNTNGLYVVLHGTI